MHANHSRKISLESEITECDVTKEYLQQERHGGIHYDDDDQCEAPVMGDTYDLRGRHDSRMNSDYNITRSFF